MENLVKNVTSEAFSQFPQVSREAMRGSLADTFARIFVEKQLAKIRQSAIEAVRAAILPTIDQAIAEALAAVDHEDDLAWDRWKTVLSEAPEQ